MNEASQSQPLKQQPAFIGAIKIKDGLFIGDEYAA